MQSAAQLIFTPLFFQPVYVQDAFELDLLLQDSSVIVIDTLIAQLTELYKIRNIGKEASAEEIEKFSKSLTADNTTETYGTWVYYPWKKTVVRLLNKEEFIEVKTSRNRNKISSEEQNLLQQKCIGIIGLSVGQSVATTLAMERCLGSIRLADFDSLDLSNCNRLRSSVLNLGLPKAIIAAREIAELDPYIHIEIWEQGINANNIDSFFCNNNRLLDCVIEECDSIDIKILARQKAKQYRVPVIMEMSDRGMIDVERYDIDASYSMFHGALDALDCSPEVVSGLSAEQKFQYLYKMVDGNNVSEKMKASLQAIGISIATWPQLASAVALGGAISTDLARRVLLGEHTSSGRYYVDLDKIFAS